MDWAKMIGKGDYFQVADGIWGMKEYFVNVYMVQNEADGKWVLIDTGLPISGSSVKKMAADLFGEDNRPACIILTHGHFDHAGSVKELAQEWNIQVYAHKMEMPYLTGRSSYPPADPTVGGGLISTLSWTFPMTPIDIRRWVVALPANGHVPGLDGWKWLHTPGHAPGHVSLWREADKTLIAGDALATVQAESAMATVTQQQAINRPPAFANYDWVAAEKSVQKLADLKPNVVAAGHGQPMRGKAMQRQLDGLADNFYRQALPAQGRYRNRPAVVNASGLVFIPPKEKEKDSTLSLILAGVAGVVAFGVVMLLRRRRITA
ncbi:MBL fold metallo-hydrolase [Persicitalea jodogahamensis]|uniref:MBL fold metallo-hydrolase n=1 Tax=Persicitalea jodogahamensis TaxID=402147 RepID=A0A8J3DAV2_9BACT|nr:MBL fold metallo-hydrolase [Persicitalea jodogahamensis]GHB76316.1 MBL fold metallo-hydrolase [Persicitalea jodogahamensis]